MAFIKFKVANNQTVCINSESVQMFQKSGKDNKHSMLFFDASSGKGMIVEEEFNEVFHKLNK